MKREQVVELEVGMGVAGYITMELIRRDGSIKQRLTFKNLITNVGLDQIMGRTVAGQSQDIATLTQAGIMSAAVGTGSTAPANTDTTLVSEIAPADATNRATSNGGYSNTGPTYVSGPPDYWYRRTSFLFDFTEGNGNLTEVAIFGATSGGDMFMRQLIKDSGGTPTTLVKTSAEQLRVIYEFRVYPPTADTVQTAVAISGTNYDITTRVANANVAAAWGNFSGSSNGFMAWSPANRPGRAIETATLGARTAYPAGTTTQCATMTSSAYTNGTYYRDVRYEWGATIANYAGGIGSITHGPNNGSAIGEQMFQTSFVSALAKDATKRLRLDVRYTVTRV